jgi:hypothetical protein
MAFLRWFIGFLLWNAFAWAQPTAKTNPSTGVETVYVGAYVTRIFDISLHENHVSFDFYLWFRWKDDRLNPQQTFQFMNGKLDDKQEVQPKHKIGEYNYVLLRLVGTLSKYWDVERFPLDEQVMRLTIEDHVNDANRVRYVADLENSGINPQLRFPGYELSHDLKGNTSKPIARETNYGDISLPTGMKMAYPQFRYDLYAHRVGFGYFWKLFTGLFVATLISFLAFFIKVTNLDPRFGLGVGSLFAGVASQYVSASAVPETHILTLADKLHVTAFAFILLALVESTISLALFESGREALSKRIDHLSFYVMLPLYVAATAFVALGR